MSDSVYRRAPLGAVLYPARANSRMIKGDASTGKIVGFIPAYSASGQDIWVPDTTAHETRPGLVLSAVGARCGKTFLANHIKWSTVANTVSWVFSPNAEPRFVHYVVNDETFWVKGGAAQPYVRVPDSLRKRIPFPDAPTQRRIADYLDRETAQIDAMAEALDGLVARLEERHRAILGRAVRDEEGRFTLANVQAITTINSGDAIEASEIDQSGEYPVYGGNGVRGFTHRFNQTENRVLIGRQGALCGNVHIACAPFWASEHALVLTPHRKTDIRWLAYTLDDQGLGALSMSAAQPGITASGVGRQKIPLPPLDEQRRIADHLDAETAKIDAMIAKAGELRALLDERRSALITATVTGQHPVPEEP